MIAADCDRFIVIAEALWILTTISTDVDEIRVQETL